MCSVQQPSCDFKAGMTLFAAGIAGGLVIRAPSRMRLARYTSACIFGEWQETGPNAGPRGRPLGEKD